MADADRCICCGEIVPEGRQICPQCERKIDGGKKMIWDDDISFEGYCKKVFDWYEDPEHFIGDPPIPAQYALDLIFKTLIDDKKNYEFLTAMPESTEQINSIMLELILRKYSRKYRKFIKRGNYNG